MNSLYAHVVSFFAATQHKIREEKGATAVEYGLMVGLIAVVIIVAVTLLGKNLNSMFEGIAGKLSGSGSGTTTP